MATYGLVSIITAKMIVVYLFGLFSIHIVSEFEKI